MSLILGENGVASPEIFHCSLKQNINSLLKRSSPPILLFMVIAYCHLLPSLWSFGDSLRKNKRNLVRFNKPPPHKFSPRKAPFRIRASCFFARVQKILKILKDQTKPSLRSEKIQRYKKGWHLMLKVYSNRKKARWISLRCGSAHTARHTWGTRERRARTRPMKS